MLRRFYARSGGIYGVPYDHESCIEVVADVIANGVCIVGPKSCAGAMVLAFPFNRKIPVAHVVFWYFEAHREVVIFDFLRLECAKLGVTHIDTAALAPRITGSKFYAERGLSLAEGHYFGLIDADPPRKLSCKTAETE